MHHSLKIIYCLVIAIFLLYPTSFSQEKEKKKEKTNRTGKFSGKISKNKAKKKRIEKQNNNRDLSGHSGNTESKDRRELNRKASEKHSSLTIKQATAKPKGNMTSKYAGKISKKADKQRRANSVNNNRDIAGYAGNIRYRDPKERYRKSSEQHSSLTIKQVVSKPKGNITSKYAGKISMAAVKKRQRFIDGNRRDISGFAGNVRYVDVKAKREKKAKEIASYRGNIRIKKPDKTKINKTSEYRGQPAKNRAPANYSPKRMRTGRKMKKKDVPTYMKEKNKITYDSREAKMWEEMSNPERSKEPKKKKQKKKKGKDIEED